MWFSWFPSASGAGNYVKQAPTTSSIRYAQISWGLNSEHACFDASCGPLAPCMAVSSSFKATIYCFSRSQIVIACSAPVVVADWQIHADTGMFPSEAIRSGSRYTRHRDRLNGKFMQSQFMDISSLILLGSRSSQFICNTGSILWYIVQFLWSI